MKIILPICLLVITYVDSYASEHLLALSKGDHVMSFVNPETLAIEAKVPVGLDSHEIELSEDHSRAYVSNTGSGKFHEINVIDVKNRKTLKNIDTFPLVGVHGLSLVNNQLWFTAEGSKTLGRYNTQTSKIEEILGTGQNRTHLLRVMKDSKRIVTANVDSGTISIFDFVTLPPMIAPTGKLAPNAKPRDEWVQTVLPVVKGIEGFDISPDEKFMWAASPDDKKLYVIDLDKKKISSKVNMNLLGAHRLKITPDGEKVLVANIRTGDFSVFDYKSHKELKRLQVGKGGAIVTDLTGKRAFVSCSLDHFVAVVDLDRYEVTGKIDVGQRPDGLAYVELK